MLHWLQFFYTWPTGAIWGNVVVLSVVVPAGWIWSKTKFWPLRPLKHAIHALHEKVDAHRASHDAEVQRRQEHDRWTHDAILAMHRGEHPPAHPHYD